MDLESASTKVATNDNLASIDNGDQKDNVPEGDVSHSPGSEPLAKSEDDVHSKGPIARSITWAGEVGASKGKAIRIPSPREMDKGNISRTVQLRLL